MWATLLFGAINTGLGIAGGIGRRRAARSQAEVLRQEAELRREQGQLAKESLFDRARRMSRQGEAFIGSQRAAFASSGVKTGEGSPLSVMRESARAIQQDVSRTRQLGQRAESLGLSQADVLGQQADIVQAQGRQQAIGAGIQAGSSFLGSIASSGAFEEIWGSTNKIANLTGGGGTGSGSSLYNPGWLTGNYPSY